MKHATRQRSSRATSNSHTGVGCRIRGRHTVTPRHLPIRHSHGQRRSTSSTPSRTHTSTNSVGGSSNTSASNSSSSSAAEDAMHKLHADLNASRTPKTHRTRKSTTIMPSSHSSTNTTTTTMCCTNTTSNNVNNISSGMSSLDEQDGDEGSSSSSSSEDGMRCRHHHHHYYYYQRIHSHSTTSSSSSTSASDASSERSTQSTESACSQDDCVKYDDDDACLYEDEKNTQDAEEDDKELTCALYRLPRALFLHVCAFLDDAGCRVVLELSRTLHRQITSADDIVWRTLCLQAWSNKQGFRDFVARCAVQRQQTYNNELRIFALQQQLLVQYYVDHDISIKRLCGTVCEEEGGERCEGVEEKSEAEYDAVEQPQNQVNTSAADEAKAEQRHEASLVSPTTPTTANRKSVTIITHEFNGEVNDTTRHNTHDPSTHYINTNHYHVSHSHSQPRRSRRRRRRRCHRSRGRSQRRGSQSVATRKRNHKHRANSSTNRGHSHHRHRSSRRGQTCKRPPPASARRRRRRHRRRHRHWNCGHTTRTPTRDTTQGQYNARHYNYYYYDSDDEDDNVYYSSRPHYSKQHQQHSRSRHPYERHMRSPTTTTPTQVVHHYPHRSRSRTHRPANPRKPSQSARRRRRRQAQQRNNNNTGNKKKRRQPACCEVHTATYEAIQRTTVQERTARQLPPCPLGVCPTLSSHTAKGKDNKEGKGSSTTTIEAGPCRLHWWQLAPDTRRELLLQRVQNSLQKEEQHVKEEEEDDIESQLSASAMDADDENEQPVHSRPRSTSSRSSSSTTSLSSCMSARQRALCLREVAMRVTQARSTQLYYSNSNSAKSGVVAPTPQSTHTTEPNANNNAVKEENDIHALVPVVSSSSAPPPPPVMSWKFAYYMACREAKRTRLSIQDLLDGVWLVCFRATGNVHPIYFHADQSLTMDKALFTFSPTTNEESSSSSSSNVLPSTTRAIRNVIQGVHPTTTTSTSTDYMHASYVNSHGSHEAAPPPTISLRSLDDGSHQYAQRSSVLAPSSTLLHSHTTINTSTTTTTTNSGGSSSIPAAAPPLPSLRYHLLQGGAQLVVHNFPPLQVIRRSGTTEGEIEEDGTEDTAHISVSPPTTTMLSSPSLTEPQAASSSSLLDRVFADEPRRSLQLLYSGTQHTLTSSSQGVRNETMREVVQRLKDQGGLHVGGLFTQNTVDNNNTTTTTTSTSMSSMNSTYNNVVRRDAAQVSARIAEDWGWTLSSNFVKIFSIELHTPLFVERLGRIAGLNTTFTSEEDVKG